MIFSNITINQVSHVDLSVFGFVVQYIPHSCILPCVLSFANFFTYKIELWLFFYALTSWLTVDSTIAFFSEVFLMNSLASLRTKGKPIAAASTRHNCVFFEADKLVQSNVYCLSEGLRLSLL